MLFFSQNKMQIIDEPARKILVLLYITGQVHTQLSCQVELVAYFFFALGFIFILSFCMGAVILCQNRAYAHASLGVQCMQ